MSVVAGGRTVWRLVKELDLTAIEREALTPVKIGIAAADRESTRGLARALADEPGIELHPAFVDVGFEAPPLVDRSWTALVVVAPGPELGRTLEALVARWAPTTPVMAVVEGPAGRRAASVPGVSVQVSARSDTGDDAGVIRDGLIDLPGIPRLALARTLPALQRPIFERLIEDASRANATYALTAALAETVPVVSAPLNVADMVVLTKNQLLLAYRIALGAGKSGRPRDLMTEIVGVLGSGFLLRQSARSLVGLVPVAGIVPKVAVAYAGTWAVGQAVVAWATKGERVSRQAVGEFYRAARDRGRELARRLVGSHQR
jgi:uncharacterized protein (DUF697 family)